MLNFVVISGGCKMIPDLADFRLPDPNHGWFFKIFFLKIEKIFMHKPAQIYKNRDTQGALNPHRVLV